MKKIIFLDLDGVVNAEDGPYRTITFLNKYFDPALVNNLNMLFSEVPDLKFVLSSTWREDMESCKLALEDAGFEYWERLCGTTSTGGDRHRGERILEWLKDNGEVDYLVIDDKMRNIRPYISPERLIETDPAAADFSKLGLTRELTLKCIGFLKE